MKYSKVFFLLTCILCVAGCNTNMKNSSGLDHCAVIATIEAKDGETLVVCDPAKIKETIELPLSSLVEDFRIIRLDNRDEALVKSGYTCISENYIGTYSYQMPYKLFNKKGEFITNIGAIGQGPNEYNSLYGSVIDEENNRIYLTTYTANKILVYDLQGNYYDPIPLTYPSPKSVISIKTKEQKVIVGNLAFDTGEEVNVLWEQDFEGNIIHNIKMPHLIAPWDYSNEIYSFQNDNVFDYQVGLWVSKQDSLYYYNEQKKKIIPTFTVKFNTETVPIHTYNSIGDYYLAEMVEEIEQNGNFYQAMIPNYKIIVDKNTGKGARFQLINDYLGNTPMTTWLSIFSNGYLNMNMEPSELEEMLEAALLKPEKLKPEEIRKLTEIKNVITEDDNNYILTGKLRTGKIGRIITLNEKEVEELSAIPIRESNLLEEAIIEETDTIYDLPYYTGLLLNWQEYYRTNNKYKDWPKEDNIAILVSAIIERNGTANSVTIVKGSDIEKLNEEAIRLIENASFDPGRDKEKNPVRSKMIFPVYFPPL